MGKKIERQKALPQSLTSDSALAWIGNHTTLDRLFQSYPAIFTPLGSRCLSFCFTPRRRWLLAPFESPFAPTLYGRAVRTSHIVEQRAPET